jgi:hypothetical protein
MIFEEGGIYHLYNQGNNRRVFFLVAPRVLQPRGRSKIRKAPNLITRP